MGLGRVTFILSSIVIAFLVNRFHEGGAFRTLQPHSDYATCKKVYGASGPEDAIILDDGTALISGGDRRKWLVEGFEKQVPGCGIYKYDLKSDTPPTLVPVQGLQGSFHPHGIGIWKSDTETLIFAANHGIASEGESVVILKYENATLYHVKTVFHTLFVSLNDVVPVGKNSFYVTNDHRQSRGFHLLQVVEDLLNLCLGNVVYYSDGFAQEVVTRLGFANGLAVDNYGRLYVAEATGNCVGIYQRDSSGSVKLIDKVKLYSAADNIDIVDNGNGDVTVYIASHPNSLKFLIHSANKDAISPSQVFKIKVSKYNEVRVEEEYLSEGEDLSGSSIAAYWNHKRLIGAVFDDHFLVCNEK